MFNANGIIWTSIPVILFLSIQSILDSDPVYGKRGSQTNFIVVKVVNILVDFSKSVGVGPSAHQTPPQSEQWFQSTNLRHPNSYRWPSLCWVFQPLQVSTIVPPGHASPPVSNISPTKNQNILWSPVRINRNISNPVELQCHRMADGLVSQPFPPHLTCCVPKKCAPHQGPTTTIERAAE